MYSLHIYTNGSCRISILDAIYYIRILQDPHTVDWLIHIYLVRLETYLFIWIRQDPYIEAQLYIWILQDPYTGFYLIHTDPAGSIYWLIHMDPAGSTYWRLTYIFGSCRSIYWSLFIHMDRSGSIYWSLFIIMDPAGSIYSLDNYIYGSCRIHILETIWHIWILQDPYIADWLIFI